MYKTLTIFIINFYLFNTADAQKHDYIWTMGYGSSYPSYGGTNINFNSVPPDTDYIKRNFNFNWDCSSICDEKGNLLFYTNGCKIFNKQNKLTQNGEGLNPGQTSTDFCSLGNLMTQGSLFLPHPADTSLYYLFHLRPEYIEKDFLGGIGDKIYYTLLDKSRANGDGEVLSKNNIIHEDTLAFGKMTAVRHGNGRDWWIAVPRMLKNQYIKLLLTANGIKGPFFQNIGFKNLDDDGTGQAVFSPDGTKYIHFDRYNDLSVLDFDRCSGVFSNFRRILLPIARDSVIIKGEKYPKYTIGGVAVSPNSKYLYVTTEENIYQYNLSAFKIKESVKLIAQYDQFIYEGLPTSFLYSQIAPDNKIYINCASVAPFMHVINNPDEEGLACKLTQHSFRLPTYNAFSIPNFPNFRLGALKGSPCDTLNKIATKEIETGIKFKVFPNPVADILYIQCADNQINTNLKIKILDLSGSVLLQKAIEVNGNNLIDISELKEGFYLINLYEDNRLVKADKFVKSY